MGGIDFMGPVAEAVTQHHERVGDSGYLDGLRGEQIHPLARILAVADVAEAMGSLHPYRPALGTEGIADELTGHPGRCDAAAFVACHRILGIGYPSGWDFGLRVPARRSRIRGDMGETGGEVLAARLAAAGIPSLRDEGRGSVRVPASHAYVISRFIAGKGLHATVRGDGFLDVHATHRPGVRSVTKGSIPTDRSCGGKTEEALAAIAGIRGLGGARIRRDGCCPGPACRVIFSYDDPDDAVLLARGLAPEDSGFVAEVALAGIPGRAEVWLWPPGSRCLRGLR